MYRTTEPKYSPVPFHAILYSPKHTHRNTHHPIPTYVLSVGAAHKAAGLANSQDRFGSKDSANNAVAHVPTAGNLSDFVMAFERSHRFVSSTGYYSQCNAVDARTDCGKV